MLYDQAMLAMAYTEAYLATGEEAFRETVEGVLDYVSRDLRSPDGSFYSAEDADSEGEEGRFYVWTSREVMAILGEEAGTRFSEIFDIRKDGNFRDEATGKYSGANILHMKEDGADPELNVMLRTLDLERSKRIRPSLDDKVLADWNSLMVSAFARAYQTFGRKEYLDTATRAAEVILNEMVDERGRVKHVKGSGKGFEFGYIDDHAFLVNALLDLYESNFDADLIRYAVNIADMMIERFWDPEGKGFFLSPADGEKLIIREKEAYDGAYPSGNSFALSGLVRLSRMTGNSKYEEIASLTGGAFRADLERAPWGFTQMLSGFMHAAGPSREIVIAGDPLDEDTGRMIDVVRSRYYPGKVLLLRDPGKTELAELAPFTAESLPIDGRATAYVCQGWNCDVPSTDPEHLKSSLDRM